MDNLYCVVKASGLMHETNGQWWQKHNANSHQYFSPDYAVMRDTELWKLTGLSFNDRKTDKIKTTIAMTVCLLSLIRRQANG